jgi:hypothetical protein
MIMGRAAVPPGQSGRNGHARARWDDAGTAQRRDGRRGMGRRVRAWMPRARSAGSGGSICGERVETKRFCLTRPEDLQWDILVTPERTSAFLARHGM